MGAQADLTVKRNNTLVLLFCGTIVFLGLKLEESVSEHLHLQLGVHILDLLTVESLSKFAGSFIQALRFKARGGLHAHQLGVGSKS